MPSITPVVVMPQSAESNSKVEEAVEVPRLMVLAWLEVPISMSAAEPLETDRSKSVTASKETVVAESPRIEVPLTVKSVENLPAPTTSKATPGAVVPMPTLVLAVSRFNNPDSIFRAWAWESTRSTETAWVERSIVATSISRLAPVLTRLMSLAPSPVRVKVPPSTVRA